LSESQSCRLTCEFACNICSERFRSVDTLSGHIDDEHPVCPFAIPPGTCGRRFRNIVTESDKSALYTHLILEHIEDIRDSTSHPLAFNGSYSCPFAIALGTCDRGHGNGFAMSEEWFDLLVTHLCDVHFEHYEKRGTEIPSLDDKRSTVAMKYAFPPRAFPRTCR